MSTETRTDPATRRSEARGYRRLWRHVPQELGFLLFTLPVVVFTFPVLHSVFWAGVSLVAVVIGVFIVVAALYLARWFGTFELMRLRWAGRPAIREPRWLERGADDGFWRIALGPATNGHYWLYLVHGMVVNFVVGIVSWTITVVWLSVAFGGLSFWFWGQFLPNSERNVWIHQYVLDFLFRGNTFVIDPLLGESLFMLLVGVIFTLTLPLVTRTMTLMHNGIAVGMLGAWPSEELQQEVADLSASRGAAVAAEDRSLRRLERDIHDGPQQRLVRLQMDLAAAERKMESDPDAAATLIAEARGHAHETLEELRALSRGLVPPILQDRGLAIALESLAARCPVPVVREIQLGAETRLPPEIERSAYFIASELLTNVAKHSGASSVRLHLALRQSPEPTGNWLDLWVIDNGRGGASFTEGHGLRGLDERLRGLRGVLVVDSPAGGPTTIGAHIPLQAPLG